jgi:hypothetical protein
MGSQFGRDVTVDIPEATHDRKDEFWKSNEYKLFSEELSQRCLSETKNLEPIIELVQKYIKEQHLEKSTILEIGSGDGAKTKIFREKWNIPIIATDMKLYGHRHYQIDEQLSHEAVKKYEGKFDILLMVYPLPNCYMDYYAIKEFELQTGKPKHLIFAGELGAADGGPGMYQYLLKHPHWKLQKRGIIYGFNDMFGVPCEKEVFIFRID